MRPLVDAEKCRTETVSFRPKEGRRQRAIVRYEDDGFRVNEEFRIDLEPNLDGEAEEIYFHHGVRGVVFGKACLHQ